MKVIKYILVFTIPVVLFLNLWALINLGDDYSFRGLKDAFAYTSTFKGFASVYDTWIQLGDYFTIEWYEVVASVLAPVYIIGKMLFAFSWLVGSLVKDLVIMIGWFFGWIFEMIS